MRNSIPEGFFISIPACKGAGRTASDRTQAEATPHPTLSVKGILLTAVDGRTKSAADFKQIIHDSFGQSVPVFDTTIPRSKHFEDAPTLGKSIHLYKPREKGSEAYRQLGMEVVQI